MATFSPLQWVFFYGLPLILVVTVGPIILERKGGKAYTVFAISVWFIFAISVWFKEALGSNSTLHFDSGAWAWEYWLTHPRELLEFVIYVGQKVWEDWLTHPRELGANFFGISIGFGVPVLASIISVWLLKSLQASKGVQAVGSLVVGLLGLLLCRENFIFNALIFFHILFGVWDG